jgi:hypothetical protein
LTTFSVYFPNQTLNQTANDRHRKGQLGPVLEFLNNLWGRGTELEQGCHNGPPSYTAWRNWFFGIDSWAPSKIKILALSNRRKKLGLENKNK